jgi:hypothetical protein
MAAGGGRASHRPRSPPSTPNNADSRKEAHQLSNYGLHIQEIVSDTHRAVTNLTEQDAENRARQLTRWHASATHTSEPARVTDVSEQAPTMEAGA